MFTRKASLHNYEDNNTLSVNSSYFNSEVKTWKMTSHFPNRKSVWHMKGMNISSEKIPGYKHGRVWSKIFMTSQRLNIAKLATLVYLRNCMLWKVGFIVRMKRRINILTYFEILYLKNQSLWIN